MTDAPHGVRKSPPQRRGQYNGRRATRNDHGRRRIRYPARRHYEEIREQLQRERARILDHLLPARFTLAGRAQVFPVAVEIRLPERSH